MSGVSRRQVMQLGAVTAACAPLSGCAGERPAASDTDLGRVARGSALRVYSWADYISPTNISRFERRTGVRVSVDAYSSADQAVAKMRLAKDTSGYDLVVMDGAYLPQLVTAEAIQPWDRARLPRLSGLSPTFLDRVWDPGNRYGIPKSGGSTGYVWDPRVIPRAPRSWSEFYAAFATPKADGRTSVIDSAASFIGSYFWGHGIDDQTTRAADYTAAERYFVRRVLPHLREFNSYPRAELAAGGTVLAQAFTGDARGALMDRPNSLRFALGAPHTDLYVDHWVLPAGCRNPAAAHAFVGELLRPAAAARETMFHGYYTGVRASRDLLPADLPFRELVFFDDGVPAERFIPAELTNARRQSLASFQKLKALASR